MLLKLYPNRRVFGAYELQLNWMTSQNNRAPVLCYAKRCALFQSHQWIQTVVAVRKRSIRFKIGNSFAPCELEIWWMTLKNTMAPLLCYHRLCASFHCHCWIQTGVTVRKCPTRTKICDLCSVWPWNFTDNLKINWAPLLWYFKRCASLDSHWLIQTGVTVRTRPNWGNNCDDLCDLDLWPLTLTFGMDITFVKCNGWPRKTIGHLFCVMSSAVNPENFAIIPLQEHCEICVTDGRTDGQTDGQTGDRTYARVNRQKCT